jgi:hypothetical protein
MAKTAGTTLLMIVLGGILGGYVGELMALLIPAGFLHDIFIKGFTLGFNDPFVFNLRIIVLTFGAKIFLNLFGLIGMILGLFLAK